MFIIAPQYATALLSSGHGCLQFIPEQLALHWIPSAVTYCHLAWWNLASQTADVCLVKWLCEKIMIGLKYTNPTIHIIRSKMVFCLSVHPSFVSNLLRCQLIGKSARFPLFSSEADSALRGGLKWVQKWSKHPLIQFVPWNRISVYIQFASFLVLENQKTCNFLCTDGNKSRIHDKVFFKRVNLPSFTQIT